MQPAFIPPASYFRLFAASDLFVVLDNVQFNRRWYTHRQKLTARNGRKEWLTLPIKKTPRDTTMIKDLEWQDNAQEKYERQLIKFFPDRKPFSTLKTIWGDPPMHHVVGRLKSDCFVLDIPFKIKFSSAIPTDITLYGQDRIIAICKHFGATEYINSEGGISLYEEKAFNDNGIKLTFLPPWQGGYDSILERLAKEKPEDIREDIYEQI